MLDPNHRQDTEDSNLMHDDGSQEDKMYNKSGLKRYQYSNPYFEYIGQWEEGVKHGEGTLKFSDGGYYKGEFKDGQITGYGIRVWPDGKNYRGYWTNGEKDGEGVLECPNGESYNGDWRMNVWHGCGKWVKPTNETVEGVFVNHKPHGHCSIRMCNGDLYQGNVSKGIVTGKGMYKSLADKMCYEGDFVNGVRQGIGKLYAISTEQSRYIYEGEFDADKPVHQPNQMLFYQEVVEEEPQDPKKKDPKKGAEEEDDNPYKIVYEVGKSEPINFEIRCVFQGEPYEDDTPLDEEELKKQPPKKGKNADEPEIRMVTPDPVIITQESGRNIEFELGRMEIPQKDENGNPDEQPPANDEDQEPVWTPYKFDQSSGDIKTRIDSEEGVVKIEGLIYELKDGLKGGKYELRIRDITNKITNHLAEIKVSVEIVDPEEPPVPAKGKKK